MTQKELTLLNLGDSLDNISNIDPRGYGVSYPLSRFARIHRRSPLHERSGEALRHSEAG